MSSDKASASVELWGPTQALAITDDVYAVHDTVFGDHPDPQVWRSTMYERHSARTGFRLAVAHVDERLVGFAWGYVGERGQYWSDKLVDALPEAVTDIWVGGHFDFVELAVLPGVRRQGLGRRLHDCLLDGVSARRALLGTQNNTESPAVRLYTARGWRKLGELSPDMQVMGIELRG